MHRLISAHFAQVRGSFAIGVAFVALFLASSVVAQGTGERKTFHRYWGTFLANENLSKRCYAASKPLSTQSSQSIKSRGEPFLLVSTFPADGAINEVSVVLGFEANNEKDLTLRVDGAEFQMFGQGKNAWLASSDDNDKVVRAMRAGSKAIVKAVSGRGTVITDEYSLIGLTKALNSVTEICK